KALTEPTTLRLIQGISTKPATGSQTKPSKFDIAMAKASAACCGVPPATSTAAAAPMAEALPTSAWQPPVAPAIIAWLASIIRKGASQSRNWVGWSRSQHRRTYKKLKTLGAVPVEPELGVAHIMPGLDLTSFVANALPLPVIIVLPANVVPA